MVLQSLVSRVRLPALIAGLAACAGPPPTTHGTVVFVDDAVLVVQHDDTRGRVVPGVEHYATGATDGLDRYSDTALRRVWKAVRFSWWLTTLMHRFPSSDDFDRKIQVAELDHLAGSEHARANFAENYTGLRLDTKALR